MSLILFVVLGATILVGLQTYHFLTGRSLLPDLWDCLRLESRSLESWDKRCVENPARADIVVCLTTTPARLPRLENTLKSLMAQSMAPLRIRLHLPRISVREGRPYVIPARLAALRSLEIVRCDDLGPATKLLPALQELPPDQPVLVVDDDSLYPPTMITDFYHALGKHPDRALALSGHLVPPDLTDRTDTFWSLLTQQPPAAVHATRQRAPLPVDILRGCDGYLIRPRYFDLGGVCNYTGAPPAARWADDVWISAHCLAPKTVIPARRMPYYCLRDWFFFEQNSLHRINNPPEADRRANTILIRYFAGRWLCSQ